MTARFLGSRATELAEFAAAWQRVCGGEGLRIVTVTGTIAAGKSRLVAEAIETLRPAPMSRLLGYARLSAPAPYDWFATAVPSGAGELPVSADALAWLSQLPDAPPRRLEPTALLRVAVDIVRQLVDSGPALLVAEDVHALDPASLALLAELVEMAELPALLVVITRSGAAESFPKPVNQLLERIEAGGRSITLRLAPLDPSEIPDGEAAWARYAHAMGRYTEAAPAALRGAATYLTAGNADAARQLIAECLGGNTDASLDPVQLVLARTLLRLGRADEAETVLRRTVPDPAAEPLNTAVRIIADLTAREREVLACLAAGMTNRQVARSLGISIRTVTVHVSNLLRKTATASRTEAALWAVQHGLA